MKRNQCIICFDRIFKKADKISTSHNTRLGKYIKHEGWYHIECLKEYIEHCNKDKIPKCPLCRDDLIIDIPGYNYNIGIRRRKHLFGSRRKVQRYVQKPPRCLRGMPWNKVEGK